MHYNKINTLFKTNDYSIISKYSAIKNAYFTDVLLEKFVEDSFDLKSWRRTPLVNRGYAARMLAIDWIVRRSIQHEYIDCFVVLGCGYDTLPFRPDSRKSSWIEIDLPQVVETKVGFIKSNKLLGDDELLEVENGIFTSSSCTYSLISCDLTNTKKLAQCLSVILCRLEKRRNIAIVNEVCLCYLNKENIVKIIQTVIDSVRDLAFRVHYIGYEQVKPHEQDSFNKVILDHFQSLGHPIKHFPTSQEIRQLFLDNLGFHHITIASMFQIYHNALMATRLELTINQLEPFDEFEEMDLYLAHYALVTGVMIIKDPFLLDYKKSCSKTSELSEKLTALDIKGSPKFSVEDSSLRRYGHSSCLLEEDASGRSSLLVSGGFGKDVNQDDKLGHHRLSSCHILTKQNDQVSSSNIDSKLIEPVICLDRMFGQVDKLVDNLIFFNGGRQNPVRNNDKNVDFIAKLKDNQLAIEHKFSFQYTEPVLRWRHKSVTTHSYQVVQVGGLGVDIRSGSPVVVWDLSSSKLGYQQIKLKNQELLSRHSFAMDKKDSNTLLVYGGLQTNIDNRDHPVEDDWSAVILDMRDNNLIPLKTAQAKCYGSNIHFISDFQLISIGGISTMTGLCNENVEIFDLRNCKCHFLDQDSLISGDQLILTNMTTCNIKNEKEILTIGGGGNYFTFGTFFNSHHLKYKYN